MDSILMKSEKFCQVCKDILKMYENSITHSPKTFNHFPGLSAVW